jgi:hypothetical protein
MDAGPVSQLVQSHFMFIRHVLAIYWKRRGSLECNQFPSSIIPYTVMLSTRVLPAARNAVKTAEVLRGESLLG